ncbi:DUF4149 domain-containing protein [Brevundimonas vancanneytii]|jgi:hypothetical protein|uniref:TMEM205-like domain-containing protein n=1 Tax=Brevundimonas vancanneytii TaxID=1325724 RepID=A0A4P1KEC8_9CAUL|nr:DUF4149 domain-containing protein [Brevundimonas vancanneytii]VTO17746.1 Uncharacterised protein [Brevundimonas vancanneytii]
MSSFRPERQGGLVGLAFVSALWLGMVIGVSFLATPIKFHAASLTLAVALDVGRVTFGLFSRVEWGLFALLLAIAGTTARARSRRDLWIGVVLLLGVLMLQSLWLLPVMNERVARIIVSEAMPRTPHHLLYIALETTKAAVLAAMSIRALLKFVRGPRGPTKLIQIKSS